MIKTDDGVIMNVLNETTIGAHSNSSVFRDQSGARSGEGLDLDPAEPDLGVLNLDSDLATC